MNPINSINPLAADLDHILTHTRDLREELRDQGIFLEVKFLLTHSFAQ
ncbi:MAG: hypothetical protein NTV01_14700 [Bacteroidia bacterium]|nr:hypothetical protein [Bacteroidia bacterium]